MSALETTVEKYLARFNQAPQRAAAMADLLADPQRDELLEGIIGRLDLDDFYASNFRHPLAAWIAGQSPQDHPAVKRVQDLLRRVQLRANGLDSSVMRLPRVTYLWVNQLADWTDLRGFPALECLSVEDFDEAAVERLRRLQAPPSLRRLEVTAYGWLNSLEGLAEDLPFECLRVGGRHLVDVAGLRGWREVHIAAANSVLSLEGLASANALERLSIGGAEELESLAGLDLAVAAGSPLRELHLRGFPKLVDASALRALTHLEVLELRAMPRLESVVGLEGKPLRSLELCDCAALTTLGDFEVAALERLDLSGTSLGDAVVSRLRAAGALREVGLRATQVTSLAPLAGARSLRRLDLRDCKALRDVAVLESLPSLTIVALGGSAILPGDLPESVRARATWAHRPLFDVLDREGARGSLADDD